MYPDLSYLLHDLFGTPVDNWASIFKTFGLMLALAFVATAMYVKSELKRKEEEGLLSAQTKTIHIKGGIRWREIISNALVFGLIGLKVPYIYTHFSEFQQDPASVLFSRKGNLLVGLLALAAYAFYGYMVQKKENKKDEVKKVIIHPHQRTGDIIITAAISGVIGSKVFSILENLEYFFQDPLGQLLSGSGLTIYGGLIFGSIAVYLLVKKMGINPIHMLDIGGPAILLGYAVGRIGCQMAGDGDWGIVASPQPDWWFLPNWLWSYTFPHNVANSGGLIEGCDPSAYRDALAIHGLTIEQRCQEACGIRYCHELTKGVYPTSVYETILSLIGFGLLLAWRKKIRIGGMLFTLYMIYNGIERFFIESIRVNEKYDYFGVHWSQAQYISVLLILGGILGTWYLWKYGKRYDINNVA